MVKERVYWQEAVPAPRWQGPIPERADVIVVGAGFTGLSAALTLAEHGQEVLVLEAGRVGDGASGRNGGQVLTGLNRSLGDLIRSYGPEAASRLFRASLAAVDLVRQRVEHYGIACDWHGGGHIEAVRSAKALALLTEESLIMRTLLHHETIVLDRSAMAEVSGSNHYQGGLLDPLSASVNPFALAIGLAQAACARGAVLREETKVRAVRPVQAGFVVQHDQGESHAAHVLVATNADSAHLDVRFRRGILPIAAHVVATSPLPAPACERVLPGRPVLYEGAPTYFYVQRTPSGSLVFGGRTEASTPGALEAELLARVRAIFDLGPDVTLTHHWIGRIALSGDGLPHAGRTAAGVHYALGYSGHGVALAVWLGHTTAEAILSGRRAGPFAAIPFPPLRRGRPLRIRYHLAAPWRTHAHTSLPGAPS